MTRRGALVAVLATTIAASVVLAAALRGDAREGRPAPDEQPPPPRAAFTIPRPVGLHDVRPSRWALVRRPVAARTRPGRTRLTTIPVRTPEHTSNLVEVLGRARLVAGRLWVRVRLAVLPNGTTGWVPRTALGGYHVVNTRLIVDRRRLSAVLLRAHRVVFRTRVGVGQPGSPTPAGRFYVRAKLTRFRSRFYGPLAFGTSARSATLTDWPAGGFIGVHGTDRPDLLPGRVSHGCVRMANRAIRRLGRLMPVGTPVEIR